MNTVKKLSLLTMPAAPTPKPEYIYNWRVLIVEDEPSIAEGIKSIIAPTTNVVPINRSSRQRSAPENLSSNDIQKLNNKSDDLRSDKFEVVWAKNPTEALEQVKLAMDSGKPFAMGFFDVMLGSEIDGIELLKQVHLIDPKIYAVFVTAYQDRTVDAINQFLGQDKSDRWDYMNKPFTEGSILQKARNSVSIWNLKEQKKLQDEELAEAANLLLQGDRSNAVAAVGRSVAHEFGNLLMRIMGHAELALMKNDPNQMLQALKTILNAGDTASAVLEKFKRQLNNTEQNINELKPINLNQCLDEAINLMSYEFNKKNIKLTRIKYQQCTVFANHHSLVQVIVNLFINATHAMTSSWQIDISVARLTAEEKNGQDEPWVEIRIRDYGPGIPEDILPKVMDPFFTTKGKQGTGLGLSICKEIIEAEHLGEFSIANHPVKGLEIIIRLPEKQEVQND